MSEASDLSPTPVSCQKSLATEAPDDLASVRRSLEESGGVIQLSCGCYMRIPAEAFCVATTRSIVESLVAVTGGCRHRPVFH